MGGMTRPDRRAIGMTLAAIAMIAGGAVLAVLQVQWVSRAAEGEEERQRRTLMAGANAVRSDIADELRVLFSLLIPRAVGTADGVKGELATAMAFWYETAPFPALVRGAYVVQVHQGGPSLVYVRSDGELKPGEVPAEVGRAIAEWETSERLGAISFIDVPDGSVVVLQAVYAASDTGEEVAGVLAMPDAGEAPAGVVALHLDGTIVSSQMVPRFMDQRLEGYPYRVIDAESRVVLLSTAGELSLREPEIELALVGVSVGEQNAWMSAAHKGRPGDGPPESPMLRLWLLRSREGDLWPGVGSTDGRLPATGTILQIYHPGGSLSRAVRRRKTLNLAVSFGIIALLFTSLVVLYRLYRRTGKLRASEQEFVASMSHELRTPISVIQAASDNLARGVVEDRTRIPRYASVIRDQTKRLTTMVESILLYAGIESGVGGGPNPVEVDLAGLIDEVVTPLRQLSQEKGCSLLVDAGGLPPRACLDPMALRLVIENLVMNAIHHADAETVRLTVAPRTFGQLRITVEDDGAGIPAREQARVFAPFVRGQRSIESQRPGSGLGLHLVKRVVTLHGGGVSLESPYKSLAEILQTGSRFTVTLPLKESCGHE